MAKKSLLFVTEFNSGTLQIKRYLQEDGIDVDIHCAVTAGEAIDFLEKNRPDMMILEGEITYGTARETLEAITDPDVWESGMRLLAWLRKYETDRQIPHFPVLFMTTQPQTKLEIERKCLLFAYDELVMLPFDSLWVSSFVIKALNFSLPALYTDLGLDGTSETKPEA